MEFEKKINEELKSAMKSGDKVRLETIRAIRAGILLFKTSGTGKEMTDEDCEKLLLSEAKKRKESAELYTQGKRQDLADKELAELKIIEEFLPKQMSEEEINDFVKKLVAEVGVTDIKEIGKIMGPAMKQLRGKADGNAVQKAVREILSAK